MNKIQDPEKFFNDNISYYEPYEGVSKSDVITLLRKYGDQVRDKTLEWAANNARTCGQLRYPNEFNDLVNQESILSGKTHKDLEI